MWKLPSIAEWAKPTESEYRANLAGMNTFFGAVLGFVISDTAAFSDRDFGLFLMICAACVISILYMSFSHNKLIYAGFSALLIWLLPDFVPEGAELPSKLQPTLIVWAIMAVILELFPRRPDPQPKA